MKNEAALGRPNHSFHRMRGDLTLEKHSPVKKDVSVFVRHVRVFEIGCSCGCVSLCGVIMCLPLWLHFFPPCFLIPVFAK